MPEIDILVEELKNHFTTELILTHFDLTNACIIERDTSDFPQGAIIS
jgi:hypothetical protein